MPELKKEAPNDPGRRNFLREIIGVGATVLTGAMLKGLAGKAEAKPGFEPPEMTEVAKFDGVLSELRDVLSSSKVDGIQNAVNIFDKLVQITCPSCQLGAIIDNKTQMLNVNNIEDLSKAINEIMNKL